MSDTTDEMDNVTDQNYEQTTEYMYILTWIGCQNGTLVAIPPLTVHDYSYAIVLPVLLVVGFVGNVFTYAVIKRSAVRFVSTSLYLCFLMISDNMQLLSEGLIMWLDFTFEYRLMLSNVFICKIFKYIPDVSSQLSTWLLVVIVFECVVKIMKPRWVQSKFCVKRTHTILVIAIFCSLLFNLHNLFGHQLHVDITGVKKCGIMIGEYFVFHVSFWRWIDISLYYGIPLMLLIPGTSIIIKHLNTTSDDQPGRVPYHTDSFKIAVALIVAFFVLQTPRVVFLFWSFYEIDKAYDLPCEMIEHYLTSFDLRFALNLWTAIVKYSYISLKFVIFIAFGPRFRAESLRLLRCKSSEGDAIPNALTERKIPMKTATA